jgi:hypothetical protein
VDLVRAQIAAYPQVTAFELQAVGDLQLRDELAEYVSPRLGGGAE